MTHCPECGRRPEPNGISTHWIGCPRIRSRLAAGEEFTKDVTLIVPAAKDTCGHEGCPNPRRPQGKGPRPKYCEDHSDPKSRK